jgi:hypothetical protein
MITIVHIYYLTNALRLSSHNRQNRTAEGLTKQRTPKVMIRKRLARVATHAAEAVKVFIFFLTKANIQ